jgi:hypothetical protein
MTALQYRTVGTAQLDAITQHPQKKKPTALETKI